MLKKMRWRFILAAMAAITAVVLALALGVNLWSRHITTQRQDDILAHLMERELNGDGTGGPDTAQDDRGKPPARPDQADQAPDHPQKDKGYSLPGEMAMPGPFGGHSREFGYMLRYFVVRCDSSNTATEVSREFIASVDEQEARRWGEAVVKSGHTAGYLNGYRYRRQTTMEGSVVLFLNSEREIQSMRTLLLVSAVMAVVSLLVVFALVVLFSRRAIAPYVRNIETQKRFITDAGHELKTPLTAISASADVLAMDLPEDEWVANIQSECARMSRLVGDLVTLSRLDEERPFPDRTDFSLSEAVWEIAEPMQSLARAKGKDYHQAIDDGLICHGDRAAIQQLVSILLDNALKYTPSGGAIRLNVGKVKGKNQVQVFNTCDLQGVEVQRLFDRFYRPDAARSSHTGGTGIGLSIAKATAQAHGGDITAQAQDGGLLFTVRL